MRRYAGSQDDELLVAARAAPVDDKIDDTAAQRGGSRVASAPELDGAPAQRTRVASELDGAQARGSRVASELDGAPAQRTRVASELDGAQRTRVASELDGAPTQRAGSRVASSAHDVVDGATLRRTRLVPSIVRPMRRADARVVTPIVTTPRTLDPEAKARVVTPVVAASAVEGRRLPTRRSARLIETARLVPSVIRATRRRGGRP